MSRTASPKLLQDVAPDFSYSVACLANDGIAYKCLLTTDGWTNWASQEYAAELYPEAIAAEKHGTEQDTPAVHPRSMVVAYVWIDLREDPQNLNVGKSKIDIVLSCPVVHGMDAVCAKQEIMERNGTKRSSTDFASIDLKHVFLCVDVSCSSNDLQRVSSGKMALQQNQGLQAACELTKYIEECYPQLGGLTVAVHDHPCARLALDNAVQIVDLITAKTMNGNFGHLGLVAFFDDLRYGNHEDAIQGVVQYYCYESDPMVWAKGTWKNWAKGEWEKASGSESADGKLNKKYSYSFPWFVLFVVFVGIAFQFIATPEGQAKTGELATILAEQLQHVIVVVSTKLQEWGVLQDAQQ